VVVLIVEVRTFHGLKSEVILPVRAMLGHGVNDTQIVTGGAKVVDGVRILQLSDESAQGNLGLITTHITKNSWLCKQETKHVEASDTSCV
jgi:hypothetical protein